MTRDPRNRSWNPLASQSSRNPSRKSSQLRLRWTRGPWNLPGTTFIAVWGCVWDPWGKYVCVPEFQQCTATTHLKNEVRLTIKAVVCPRIVVQTLFLQKHFSVQDKNKSRNMFCPETTVALFFLSRATKRKCPDTLVSRNSFLCPEQKCLSNT